MRYVCLLAPVLICSACAGPSSAQRHRDSQQAIKALQAGQFDKAQQQAAQNLTADKGNPYARLVSAIVRYRKSTEQLSLDVRTVLFGGLRAGGFNARYLVSAFEQAEQELALVEDDLAAAATHSDVVLELCLACWEVDWNRNGRIDRSDRLLFQIEQDADGKRIPKGDPRRKPTFRFDHGDVTWARAFVSFQRALLELVMAYDWAGANKIVRIIERRQSKPLVIKLAHPEKVARARRHLLRGLELSDQARQAYLAETDDEREWVPNPRQKNHPLPLPVDQALYDTWEGVVGDLTRLVQGKEGLSVAELAQLGDHHWKNPPQGYLDIGRMLSEPRDIVLDRATLRKLIRARDVEAALANVFGDYYVPQMKASPILKRLNRMRSEIERGEESFSRKLRYLLWIN